VKQFWSSLTTKDKLATLRIEDRRLVRELYDIQQSLYACDVECHILGVHCQDKSRQQAGAHYFDVEGVIDGKGNLCATAFIALQPFVEMECMFDFIEERLGRPFLEDAANLDQKHWASLLKPSPTSWADYVRVALRLVEISLRISYQEALSQKECVVSSPSDVMHTPQVMSQSAKRKSRQKRAAERRAATAEEESGDWTGCEELFAPSEAIGVGADVLETQDSRDCRNPIHDHCMTTSGSLIKEPSNEVSQSPERGAWESPNSSSEVTKTEQQAATNDAKGSSRESLSSSPPTQGENDLNAVATFDAEPALAASQILRQSARSARVDAVVMPALIASQALRASAREAWVSAEIRMRSERGRVRPPWVLADGSSGENWVAGFKTVVKNTFLDVELSDNDESCALRARSWPAYGGA
jgi:hypothetical protein